MILLVEDNPDDEALTLRAFQKMNLANDMVVARDGVEALNYLFGEGEYSDRDMRDMPALIMLDLKLPKIDGIEVLRRLRSDPRTKLIPVVILTSSREEQDIIATYNLGANSYVQKPVNFEEFAQAAAQLGSYWLLLNASPPGGA